MLLSHSNDSGLLVCLESLSQIINDLVFSYSARIELQSLAAQEQRRLQDPERTKNNNDDDHDDTELRLSSSPLHGSSDEESWTGLESHHLATTKSDEEVIPLSPAENSPSTRTEQQQVRYARLNREARLSIIQCFQRLLEQRGELYKGAAPIVTTLAISNFIFFGVRSFLQPRLFSSQQDKNNRHPSSSHSHVHAAAWKSLIASTLAGIVNVLLTNPLWVTNLRIVTGQATHSNLFRELAHIITSSTNTQEGQSPSLSSSNQQLSSSSLMRRWATVLQQLWQGTGSSLLLVSNPVIQFVVYERIRQIILMQDGSGQHNNTTTTLSPSSAFWAGALSKAVATIITYPLQLTQALLRMQKRGNASLTPGPPTDSERDQDDNKAEGESTVPTTPQQQASSPSSSSSPEYQGTLDCLRQLYAKQGFQGLYTGLEAKLLQTVLSAAFTFLTYEQILRAVHTVLVRQRRVLLQS